MEPVQATDRDRDRIAQRLRDHYAAGTLSWEELESRLTRALSAATVAELRDLTADLPKGVAHGPAPRVPPRHHKPLCRVDVTEDALTVRLLGMAWFHVGTRTIHLPMARATHVATVQRARGAVAGQPLTGCFSKSIFAGVIKTPTGRLFAAARPLLPALVVDLRGAPYTRVVLYPEDMPSVAARIRAWHTP